MLPAITLIAAVSFLLNREAGMNLELSARESEWDLAVQVAETGLVHGARLLHQADCTGYPGNLSLPFGDHYDPAATAGARSDFEALGVYQWDLTALVSGWVGGSYPNQGTLLAITGAEVDSAMFSSGDSTFVIQRPKLTVSGVCECAIDCTGGEPQNRGDFTPDANFSSAYYGVDTRIQTGTIAKAEHQ